MENVQPVFRKNSPASENTRNIYVNVETKSRSMQQNRRSELLLKYNESSAKYTNMIVFNPEK